MTVRQLIYAPDHIFSQKAKSVDKVTDDIRNLIDDLFDTMEFEKAVGMAATMIGEMKRIIVVNLCPNGVDDKRSFINPEITWKSKETETHTEASICFRGIDAKITRPNKIKINYLDCNGKQQEEEAEGFLATVIQHECDYLDGKVFLDYLSKMKREMLVKKMQKFIKAHPPHIHNASCNH
ncbi:MAG: peptide deformylase [Rickettsiales bacterium]